MEEPIISFEEFELPFLSKSTGVEGNEDTSESHSEMEDDEVDISLQCG